jgi:cysteine-rich repeat protein
LLENLEYNINLTNAGYCVDKGTPPATINFVEEIKSGIKYPTTNTACENDFDCVDPAGVPVAGTNGICSKSKDKFLRDWTRLWDVQSAQSKFTAKAPELKSGTFIPNYTLSRWPSWGSLGIGSDPLNTWTLCENSDLQTCWNTSESKFLCPAKMSVYEYEFVTSTAKYKLHVPFEYFKNDSLIKKIFGGEFITDPDSFTIEQSCKPNQKYSPLSGSCGDNTVQPNEQCDPPGTTFVNKSSSCNNPDGTTAVGSYVVSTCSNSCMFQNSCQKVAVCGNGIIEEGEKCDDGVLNDTYGHCAGEKNTKPCQIMYKEYCGNKFKEDNEYCDVNASNMPFVWTGNYALNKEQSCAYDCMSSGEYCGDGLLHSSEECDDGNSKSGDGCSYTCKKENNACINQQPQYYVYNTSDGNTKSVLFVTKLTQNMINSSIFPNSPISKSTKVYETEGPIDVCFANTNASEICQAAGLSCKHWTLWKLNPFSFQQSGCNIDFPPYEPGTAISVECSGVYIEKYIENIPIAQSGCGNAKMDSGEACDNGSNNGQKCVPGYNSTCSYCSSDCKKVLTVDSEKFCGNHTIDVIKKTPSTEDLKINMHVLAKWHNNNLYYPGIITSTANGLYGIEYYDGYSQLKTKQEELQIIEACDFDTDVLGNSITIRMDQKGEKVNYASADFSCTDKGKYVCAQDCTSYSAQCFSCIKADNKPVPKITLINPMHINPQTGDPYSSNDAPYVGLYRLKDYSLDNLFGTSFAPCTGQLCPLNVILSLNQFNLDPVTQGIETNNACADEYKVAFNAPQMASSADPYSVINQGLADLFDFAVNGEIGTVSHSYIMSPAVPKETYRIVVKWTPDENSTQFQGGFYSESFNDSDSKSHIKTAVDLKKYECTKSSVIGGGKNNSGYWWPDTADGKCKSSVGIYTHPIQQLGGIAIQSFTVDAKDFPLGSKIGFFVQSLADPIGLYTTKDIQVEVYNYHPNQNPTFSVYKPSYTFNISSAAQSFVNKSAKYWYVFNISVGGYISSGFANPINPNSSIQTIKQSVIKPVQTIETNTDQLVLEYFTGTN